MSSRFMAQHLKMNNALRRAHEKRDDIDFAYREIASKIRKEEWERFYTKCEWGIPDLRRLLGEDFDPEETPIIAPGHDHASMWIDKEGDLVYCYQPYKMGFRAQQELVALCDKLGLEATIDSEASWYFPGRTFLVVIRKRRK